MTRFAGGFSKKLLDETAQRVSPIEQRSEESMAGSVQGEPFQRVNVQQAKELIDSGVHVVDVREPKELVQDGMLGNAKLVPLNTLFANPREHLTQDNILFMCKVGQRSAIACEMAAAIGYTKLYNMEGGIEAWKKAGLPVEHPSA